MDTELTDTDIEQTEEAYRQGVMREVADARRGVVPFAVIFVGATLACAIVSLLTAR